MDAIGSEMIEGKSFLETVEHLSWIRGWQKLTDEDQAHSPAVQGLVAVHAHLECGESSVVVKSPVGSEWHDTDDWNDEQERSPIRK